MWCLAAEAALILVALTLGWLLGTRPLTRVTFDWAGGLVGLLATVPWLVPILAPRSWLPRPLASFFQFVEQQLGPLFRRWTVTQMLAVSVCAGVGEELLFRGVVQPALGEWLGAWAGLAGASVLFGVVHYISHGYALYATLIGLYLGGIAMFYESLLPAIVCHTLYDFLALLYLARRR